jgi:excisionase family DNA binding protein
MSKRRDEGMAVTAGRQEFSVREAADYLGVDVSLAGSLLDQGRIGGPFRGGRQLISRASLERYLDRFGGRDGLQAALREEKRQEARDRKAAIARARAYQRRAHDQAAQESLTRARETLWKIERRENRERRQKFEQLAAIDERAAGRFLMDTEPKKTPPAATARASANQPCRLALGTEARRQRRRPARTRPGRRPGVASPPRGQCPLPLQRHQHHQHQG